MERKFHVVFHFVGGLALLALWIAVIMWLWNLIVPSLTGWEYVSYWQAAGIWILFRLLSGRVSVFPSRKGMPKCRHDRMHRMSEEGRDAFIREKLNRLGSQDKSDGQ